MPLCPKFIIRLYGLNLDSGYSKVESPGPGLSARLLLLTKGKNKYECLPAEAPFM